MYKRSLFILCLLFSCCFVAAQEPRIQNRPYLDNRFLHYGFFVGLDMMDLELKNNGYVDPVSGEQWYTDIDNYQPGFVVGVLGELRLNKTFGLRLQPAIHFGQKHIVFHEQLSGRDSTQNLKSTYLSIPIALKIAAPRYNNFRPYFSVGVAPTFDLTSRKHMALRTEVFDIPELRFSFGLRDILIHKRDDLIDASLMKFTNSLDRGRSKIITLAFYFE